MHINNPQLGDFVLLRISALESIGAFLDWGQEKELFLPFSEQTQKLNVGNDALVYIYEDNNGRPTASMRIERFTDKSKPELKEEEKVALLVFAETELGFKALINRRYVGLLFKNEVFQELRYGDELDGYIKQVRSDGKIDLILQPFGNKGADDLGQKILNILKEKDGFLPLTEKSSPENIYGLFGVSKKKYKIALGGIYKKRLITIDPDGIRLKK